MSTCPYCGAETRPGDNFCLSCGHRLSGASAPSGQQAQAAPPDATVPAQADWMPAPTPPPSLYSQATVAASPAPAAAPAWPESNSPAPAGDTEAPTMRGDIGGTTVPTAQPEIENPAKFILRSDNGETVQEYTLDKSEMVIGRGATSDIVLSKDKLTSRRHAIVRYENGAYVLRDGGSSNGTFVNGQQLDKSDARQLQDGDHVGIGEYELIFRAANGSAPQSGDVADLPTIAVPLNPVGDVTYRTREDEHATAATNDEYGTKAWNGNAPELEAAQESVEQPEPPAEAAPPAPAFQPEPVSAAEDVPAKSAAADVTFSQLTHTNVPLPALPDMAPILAALSALDGQVTSLQEQLNSTQTGMREHEDEVAKTAGQLRSGVRNVAERMNSAIADVARAREALAWAELRQLMEDVMNNPRDIEYVTKLARRSRELNKVFLLHQDVLNTMAECYSLLRGLLGE